MNSKPEIVISSRDLDRLERLLASLGKEGSATGLEQELERAEVVEPHEIPPDVVTMNSTVRFRVLHSSETFERTLVYPKDMDGDAGRISVLAPVGAALLGVSEGHEIEWPRPGGSTMVVRIEEVVYQPERAGEHHR